MTRPRVHGMSNTAQLLLVGLLAAAIGCTSGDSADGNRGAGTSSQVGSAEQPLRVVLIPADGGTEDGTIADFEPVFAAITRQYDIHFELRVAQAYNAVVEGMVSGKVDVAFFGPVTYHRAKVRGAAELLAVGVNDGESVYYAGIFTRKELNLTSLADLRGRSVAFGDINSTSSFNFPVAMLLNAGVDPIDDLGNVYLTGSHANALAALTAGKVDAACASYSSFEKAITNGHVDLQTVVPLAKSDPIPYPPLAIHKDLPAELKQKLRDAIGQVHEADGVTPDMIRGYGGKRVDRYDAEFPESEFDRAMERLASVTDNLKNEMIRKAGQQ